MFKPETEEIKFNYVVQFKRQSKSNTYWHHVSSLDDAEESVGNLVHMLHAQRVERGVALVLWLVGQGRVGYGALQDAPIWLGRALNSSKTADHQDQECGGPHSDGEEDLHPSCPPHQHRIFDQLLYSLHFLEIQLFLNPHIVKCEALYYFRILGSNVRSLWSPIESHSLIFCCDSCPIRNSETISWSKIQK